MARLRAVVAFTGLALLWGLTVTAMEVAFDGFAPLLLSGVRYGLAGIVLLAYAWVVEGYWYPRTSADLTAIGGGAIFWIAIGNGVWFVGQNLTTSVLSGVMTSLIPIVTAAVSWVAIPEDRLTRTSLVGLFVSFAGAVLLFWPAGSVGLKPELLGKGLLMLGVVGTAIGGVLIRWARASLPRSGQTAWSVLLGAGLILGLSLALGEPWTVDATTATLGAVAYLVGPGTVIAYLLFFSLFERHSAIEISLVTYLVPIVAGAAGWWLFGEPVGRELIAGFTVIVAGFALMKWRSLADEVDGWVP